MHPIITRPEAPEFAEFYLRYISMVPTEDLIYELQNQNNSFIEFMRDLPDEKMNFKYADDKWSIADILQHIIDTERIYVFRMLNFVRHGWMEIPGFDQNEFARNTNSKNRNKESFIEEFDAVRKSTLEFLRTISPEESAIIGKANNNKVSVRAMGYVAYGHIEHHCKIIQEKYL